MSDKRDDMQAFFLHWIKEYIEIYDSWLKAAEKNKAGFMFICYEGLIKETKQFLPSFYRFIGFDPQKLPAGSIDELAVMYARRDVSTNTDEKLQRRDELQIVLDKDISSARLNELEPELANQLNDVISRLMEQRFKVT